MNKIVHKVLGRLHQCMTNKSWFRTAFGSLVAFLAIGLIFTVIKLSIHEVYDIYLYLSPRTNFFDYQKVAYVKHDQDQDTLIFTSTSVIKQSYPIKWNDILRCSDGEDYHFTSSLDNSEAKPVTRQEYRTLPWNYNEPFPVGQTCYLESTITMNVEGHDKTQVYIGEKFKVE